MKFAIIGKDNPEGHLKRSQYRALHLERLQNLDKQGKLILAGPFKDKAGSLIVLEAESLAEAIRFAHDDPYTKNGIFQQVEVHPFEQVFPAGTPD